MKKNKAIKLFCEFSNDINTICQPLIYSTPVTYFSHVREYKDGTRFMLNNLPQWIEVLHNQEYCHMTEYAETYHGSTLWSEMVEHLNPKRQPILLETLLTMKKDFYLENGFVISDTHKDHIDFYNVASHENNPGIVDFFISEIDMLKNFILYYKEQSVPIIKKIKHHRIINEGYLQAVVQKEEKNINQTHSPFSYHKLVINEDLILTERECECAKLLANGYSLAQIGEKLNISTRTAEYHINNFKEKIFMQKFSGTLL